MEASSKKFVELDEQLLYSTQDGGVVGTVVGKTTMIGEVNAVVLITPVEDGMILSEQVNPLEATREVEEKQCGGKANNHHERGCC